ncbi:MAG: hypothetical protein GY913_12105 [Proteobacteria bacterium]|nr:hypothetical protein [Pseudomonadota bacterium]MCP4917659.1 hypothetical protein [Pseudomonadota bacterium]
MILALLAACASPTTAPVGEVLGRAWTAPGIGAVEFPTGWKIVNDPSQFRGGRENTVLEARHGELVAILTFIPLTPPLSSGSPLDLLPLLHPVDEQATDYRLERIPQCRGAMERRAGEWVHIAWVTDGGLAVWQAFGDDPEALRTLVCDHTR